MDRILKEINDLNDVLEDNNEKEKLRRRLIDPSDPRLKDLEMKLDDFNDRALEKDNDGITINYLNNREISADK